VGQQTRGRRYDYDEDTSPRSSDRRAQRREASERDEPLKRAYEAGRRGDDPAEFQTSDDLFAVYEDGQRAAKDDKRGERREELRGKAGAKAGSVASDGAGFVLGLLAYAVLANYLRGGVPAVKAWFAAKFLNNVAGQATAQKPATPATPGQPEAAQLIRVGA
jgi:hypothetical protein